MEKNNEQQELDLFSLLGKIVNFLYDILRKIGGFCGYLLRVTFKYYYVFLLFMFAALAYSYYSTHGARRIYKAEFTLSLNDGDTNLYSEMITSLNNYLAYEDPDRFDDMLKIPSAAKGKVCTIYNQIIEDQDTTTLNTTTVITVVMNNPDAFPAIKDALIAYFKNNEHLKSLNSIRITSLKERERIFEKDIAAIDSLQKIEYFQKTKEAGVKMDQKLVFNTEKQMFYGDKLNLLKEKEAVAKELAAKSEIVTLINEFPSSKKPFIAMRHVILKNVLIAFSLFLFLLLLWDNRKPIISYLQKK